MPLPFTGRYATWSPPTSEPRLERDFGRLKANPGREQNHGPSDEAADDAKRDASCRIAARFGGSSVHKRTGRSFVWRQRNRAGISDVYGQRDAKTIGLLHAAPLEASARDGAAGR